jgi:hypothetical protein
MNDDKRPPNRKMSESPPKKIKFDDKGYYGWIGSFPFDTDDDLFPIFLNSLKEHPNQVDPLLKKLHYIFTHEDFKDIPSFEIPQSIKIYTTFKISEETSIKKIFKIHTLLSLYPKPYIFRPLEQKVFEYKNTINTTHIDVSVIIRSKGYNNIIQLKRKDFLDVKFKMN